MNHPLIAVVDAFTANPFRGNPAGVCLLEAWPSDEWMQSFAAEMRHSETAFVVPSGDHEYHIRWFTPSTEINLCGHATLATAHLLWSLNYAEKDRRLNFTSRSGWLGVTREGEEGVLDFPVSHYVRREPCAGAIEALGVEPVDTVVATDRMDSLVLLKDADEVRKASPDHTALRATEARMVCITAPDATGEYDFISRVFVPGVGIDEDPVTGSAHTLLAPYWKEKLGREEFRAFQASARGGSLSIRLREDRVLLGGRACTLFVGHLTDEGSPHSD